MPFHRRSHKILSTQRGGPPHKYSVPLGAMQPRLYLAIYVQIMFYSFHLRLRLALEIYEVQPFQYLMFLFPILVS